MFLIERTETEVRLKAHNLCFALKVKNHHRIVWHHLTSWLIPWLHCKYALWLDYLSIQISALSKFNKFHLKPPYATSHFFIKSKESKTWNLIILGSFLPELQVLTLNRTYYAGYNPLAVSRVSNLSDIPLMQLTPISTKAPITGGLTTAGQKQTKAILAPFWRISWVARGPLTRSLT